MSMAETDADDDLDPGLTEGAELADQLRDEPERLSVRDAIEKSWQEHGGELPESRQPKNDKSGEKISEKLQTRDATGKGAPERVPATPAAQGTEAAPQPASAPGGWSKEAKAEWGKLSPAIQAAVTKRETEMAAGARQLQERYGDIHRLVTTQLTAPAQKYGLPPGKILENAVSWFSVIERNPVEGLKALAQTYKIDARQLGAAAPAPAGGPSNGQTHVGDPRIDQLARTVADMQANRNQEAHQAELKAWSANKPHFEKVRQTMAQIVAGAAQMQDASILTQDGAKIDLDKVYERAIYMDPEVRAAVLKEQAEAERKARAAQVTNARRAGSSVRPGTPGGGSKLNGEAKAPKKGLSVRESIEHAMAEVRS